MLLFLYFSLCCCCCCCSCYCCCYFVAGVGVVVVVVVVVAAGSGGDIKFSLVATIDYWSGFIHNPLRFLFSLFLKTGGTGRLISALKMHH